MDATSVRKSSIKPLDPLPYPKRILSSSDEYTIPVRSCGKPLQWSIRGHGAISMITCESPSGLARLEGSCAEVKMVKMLMDSLARALVSYRVDLVRVGVAPDGRTIPYIRTKP